MKDNATARDTFAALVACTAIFCAAPCVSAVDQALLVNEADGANWPSYGRTFSESHFSPLTQINTTSVEHLGLAWSLDLDVSNSITAPLAMNGVIYLAAGYSVVHAVDAKSGKLLWRYDPHAAQASQKRLRNGWGIRGLALWQDKVYVGTQDGRLLALSAADGKLVWSVQTLLYGNQFISGPPRVFNGKVIIGNGGADSGPVRGYVTAYDAESGRKLWRFFIVPPKPGERDGEVSDEPLERLASKTWTGEWWKYGGGGTVWNAMTYDPEYDRLYIGTGNGAPINRKIRSPGGGDNLFLASVLALDAKTGKYVWHYQTTPGESWDYNSSQDMTLATITLEGKQRKVILHAPKNGFFYVLDRENGKLISAEKLGKVTWAERVDRATGRPVETASASYGSQSVVLYPGIQGVHHWPPQSYSPLTQLVYVPTLEMPGFYGDAAITGNSLAAWQYTPNYSGLMTIDTDVPVNVGKSILKAWDPKTQRAAWQIETPGASNGGTLATAGNLVFQGLADGYLHAYSADKGEDRWKFFCGTAVTGMPITYSVDGQQYLTITAGPLHGSAGAVGSVSAQWGWDPRIHPKRLLTFRLDGDAKLPPTPPPHRAQPLQAPEFKVDKTKAEAGAKEYARCILCHGPAAVAGGITPDLRASAIPLSQEAFANIVRGGALVERGMPRFEELSDTQLDALRHYIRSKVQPVER